MINSKQKQIGFTLVEIAIVLLIVSILLGYSVAMFPRQQELKQYRAADAEMNHIIEQLIAYAQVNGRLPCPDLEALGPPAVGDGLENRVGLNACANYFGFLPARTLGIDGSYNQNNMMVDPWGAGYGYAISDDDDDGDGNVDLVTVNGIRTASMGVVLPDLFICDDNNALTVDTTCATTSGNVVLGTNNEVAAVIISLGRDNEIPATSNIQAENLDDFGDGTNDKVYIYSPRRDDYDDIVMWLPTNLLFSKMIDAEQLP